MQLCQVVDFYKREKVTKDSLTKISYRVFYSLVFKLLIHIKRSSTRGMGPKLTPVTGLNKRRFAAVSLLRRHACVFYRQEMQHLY